MGNNNTHGTYGRRRGSEDEDYSPNAIGSGNTPNSNRDKKKLIMKPQGQGDLITRMLYDTHLSSGGTPGSGGGGGGSGGTSPGVVQDHLTQFVSGVNSFRPRTTPGGIPLNRSNRNSTSGEAEGDLFEKSYQTDSHGIKTIPTVFSWEGGGKEVYISGTFNNWSGRIPMTKSHHNFYLILNLPEGEHQYKFVVDGQWRIDKNLPTTPLPTDNNAATPPPQTNTATLQNNVLVVKTSDFDVLEALSHDMLNSKSSSASATVNTGSAPARNRTKSVGGATSEEHTGATSPYSHIKSATGTGTNAAASANLSSSPAGSYGQLIPDQPPASGGGGASTTDTTPPLIPPLLLQVILNKNTGTQCDPNLLPAPNHVMVNHMYALSIKDGVIVLSCIHRYRKKHVSTVIYKPI